MIVFAVREVLFSIIVGYSVAGRSKSKCDIDRYDLLLPMFDRNS